MNLKIRKRDGRLVKFSAEKITNAIAKAELLQVNSKLMKRVN